jgi:AraC-like DNA-binding protein
MQVRTLLRDGAGCSELRVSRAADVELPVRYGALSIKYVERGEERYVVNGRSRTVKAGAHLVVCSGGAGSVSIGRSVAHGLCIDVDAELINEVVHHYAASDPRVGEYALSQDFFADSRAPQGEHTSHALHQVSRGGLPHDRSVFYRLAEAVLLDRLEWQGLAQRVRAHDERTRRETLRKLLLAKEEFRMDPLKYPTARSLAAFVGCSEFHFNRAFTNTFGTSPYAYMLRTRLNEAHRLLATTDLPVSNIAMQCGFNDGATFSRAFRRCHGVAPSVIGDRARMVNR